MVQNAWPHYNVLIESSLSHTGGRNELRAVMTGRYTSYSFLTTRWMAALPAFGEQARRLAPGWRHWVMCLVITLTPTLTRDDVFILYTEDKPKGWNYLGGAWTARRNWAFWPWSACATVRTLCIMFTTHTQFLSNQQTCAGLHRPKVHWTHTCSEMNISC